MNSYKHIIIGGGIVGCSIAYELADQNEEVAVLEARKISSQTSMASSKMLHGGIRYLENLDFALVYEALKEKNYWADKKPHLVKEAPFYIPTYKESKYPHLLMRCGVFFYNLLSLFQNKQYKNLSRSKFQEQFSELRKKGFKGATVYSDAIIDDKAFTVEIANDAKAKGASFYEDNQVVAIEKKADSFLIQTNQGSFSCEKLIIAAGPFTDLVSSMIVKDWKPIILPSKGAHIWVKHEALKLPGNIVLQTKDNRVIFIIDHKHATLVGTTETVLTLEEVKLDISPTKEDIDYILDSLNAYLEGKKITADDITSSFCGIRPLVKEPGQNSKKTSRNHRIFSPQENLYIICGGKYTTCRVMAKDLIKKL